MKISRFIVLALLVLGGLSHSAMAQQTAPAEQTDTDAGTRGLPKQNAVPGMGDILNVIDKALPTNPPAGDAPAGQQPAGDQAGWSAPVRLAVVFGFLALLPSLLVMMTSFTRIVIVLSFVRRALSTQNIPPTVAVVGLALFLTFFTMSPVLTEINKKAIQPYLQDKIAFTPAMEIGNSALRDFMIRQTRTGDLELFIDMADIPAPKTEADVPLYVAIPAFAISEFRTAFEMGCLLFIPFLLIDLVVGGILLSAGMMMLPPALVSLPFKIILFVLVDGWRLLVETLVLSFQ